jgi:hypothetical protein
MPDTDAVAAELAAIRRPDGSLYRPRKLVACPVNDEDEIIAGVVVFGTHDPRRAQLLADEIVRLYADSGCVAASPGTVWWRDGFECGQRRWVTDEQRGRAGVWFSDIADAALLGEEPGDAAQAQA